LADLSVIRNWTKDRFWAEQAKRYTAWLKAQARKLAKNPELGKPVVDRPGLFVYLCLWKSSSQNGHYLFYRIIPDGIEVLEFRHTARDDSQR
jgi:plasmid stabilization system protein ParE